jgi:hypothetical protein
MKPLILLALLMATINAFAQQQTFDIITFTAPKAWEQKPAEAGIQFITEDTATGGYCVITLYKSTPATADAKENFDLAWTGLVKEMLPVGDKPEMAPSVPVDGWEVLTGHANFEREGIKGVAILVNASSAGKMVNVIILTNTNAYETHISEFLESIQLSKPVAAPVVKDGYTFTTTNFDDGWTSTVQEDWVQASKGDMRVLIHYPNKQTDAYEPDLDVKIKNAWHVLVASRYDAVTNLEYKPIRDWQSVEWVEADAVEKASGQKVHIVLFRKNFSTGTGKYLEFIMTDKNAFVQAFGGDPEKIAVMATYNKFAVAASDLAGKWTSNFSGTTQYVNIYTGLSAGMDTHASNQNFLFGPGEGYKWDIGVASGPVGNIKYQGAKSAGKFSIVNNWQIHFSDMEGKPKTYDIAFSCVKGARILWIDGQAYYTKE